MNSFALTAAKRAFTPRRGLLSLLAVALSLFLVAPSTRAGAAPTAVPAKAYDHVYLLRGAFNIFSLGMDEIADRLQGRGARITVANFLSWESLADEAIAEYKSGQVRTIILVGHSSGANAIAEMAARLGQHGVPVKLAIGLDPTSHMVASGHVDRYVNYYIAGGMGLAVARGKQFTGVLQNIDVEKNLALNHFNIDKNRALQDRVVSEIRAAL